MRIYWLRNMRHVCCRIQRQRRNGEIMVSVRASRNLAYFLAMIGLCVLAYEFLLTPLHADNTPAGQTAYVITKTERRMAKEDRTESITILSWTEKTNWFKEGHQTCEAGVCFYSEDHALYNFSDVIMMQPRILQQSGMWSWPRYRFSWQKWMAIEVEPPTQTWRTDKPNEVKALSAKNLFNITAFPVKDADVPWFDLHRFYRMDYGMHLSLSGVNHAKGKTKLAAWFVSHCETFSEREHYVSELSKYIPVDVYGKCGPLKCEDETKCVTEMLQNEYKFYIAFENSFCEDYVTEKLMRLYWYNIDIIPVVAGHVDYSSYFPAGGYIDIRDFRSEKSLAEYMMYLDKNDTAYSEIVRVKKSSVAVRKKSLFCNLCDKLHRDRDKTELVQNVVDFYNPKDRCLTPRQFYTGHVAKPAEYLDRIKPF